MNIQSATRKVITCEHCKGRGIEVSEMDTIVGDTVSFAHDCTNCIGQGVIVLEYKSCKCGNVEWIEKDNTDCIECFKAIVAEFFSDHVREHLQ